MTVIATLLASIFFPVLTTVTGCGLEVKLDERTSFLQTGTDGSVKSEYSNLSIDISLGRHVALGFRNRLNRLVDGADFIKATDNLYLDLLAGSLELRVGKAQQEYGGFEYDDALPDLYYCGMYYNNFVGAFNWGVRASKVWEKGRLNLQAAVSPFATSPGEGLYAWNLCYKGTHGIWSPKWSVNLIDTPQDWRAGHLVLGNSFAAGPLTLELDYITRTDLRDFRPFEDWSLVSKLKYSAATFIDVFAKVNLDRNLSVEDLFVPAGTSCTAWGGGIEIFPRGEKRNLRLHLVYCNNGEHNISAGITWKMKLFKLYKNENHSP